MTTPVTLLFGATLCGATLLCTLVAGFVFAFACVAMPGIGSLGDREFLRSFQAMDGVIQKQQPIFLLVWVGSIVTLAASGVLGFRQVEGVERWLLAGAVLVYLLGVQVPTLTINIPLNNQLQALDVRNLDRAALAEARKAFETRWNRWNLVRTLLAVLTATLLIALCLRL